jgi:hypothetical protein
VPYTTQGNSRVQRFNSNGDFLTAFGAPGSGIAQFNFPTGITISGDRVLVVDSINSRIQSFSRAANSYISQFGSSALLGSNSFGIAVDPASGDVLVVDSLSSQIKRFTSTGTLIRNYGTFGSGNGQLGDPYSAMVGPGGQVSGVEVLRGSCRQCCTFEGQVSSMPLVRSLSQPAAWNLAVIALVLGGTAGFRARQQTASTPFASHPPPPTIHATPGDCR